MKSRRLISQQQSRAESPAHAVNIMMISRATHQKSVIIHMKAGEGEETQANQALENLLPKECQQEKGDYSGI